MGLYNPTKPNLVLVYLKSEFPFLKYKGSTEAALEKSNAYPHLDPFIQLFSKYNCPFGLLSLDKKVPINVRPLPPKLNSAIPTCHQKFDLTPPKPNCGIKVFCSSI